MIAASVETRRGALEERVPRLILRAPPDTRVWAFRAAVSRIRASIEDASDAIATDAPWDVVERPLWSRGHGVSVALELRTHDGRDSQADLGVEVLRAVAATI